MCFNPKALNGQSAIEYLMTYGWMLLVVAIVGGGVFSLVSDQSIEGVQGFNSNNVIIDDFGVSQEDGLMFSMSDPIGQTEVQEIKVSNPDTTNVTYILNQAVSEQNTVNLPGVNPSTEENTIEVEIIYNTGSLENLSITGTITGNLEVDESFNNQKMILDGLVGYWPLSEQYSDRGTVYDLSINNNHGVKENNPEYVNRGIEETALDFDGDYDEVRIEDDLELRLGNNDFAICAWVYLRDNDPNYYQHIIRKGGVTSTGGFTLMEAGGGDQEIRFEADDREIDLRSGSGVIQYDTWTHICAKRSGDQMAVYKNNEEIGQETGEINLDDTSQVRIGYEWPGIIDDVRVYDRALSGDEVELIYEQGDIE